ncbi:amidase [Sedimentitalea nanhaiensis]|uniref:Amidase/6-aminohexanoate-cyclic-dimer hydrolase n=1 Tax=Sedimentitalea nanhaiensis TaxID=999627 RepID=A0A1I7EDC6_9RHOB|nr:amidase family protein [Sedimentitalea nanhaiensis]SFU21956.1 amidase/6-aminohexanoate-cyclic-dimer hydrolase [Sedimentitalea nanhaiensis]
MKDLYLRSDATELAARVARLDVTPDELLDCALEQVAALNPDLNAVVMIREDVARASIRAGLPEGPFRGVPFLIKDLGAEAVDFPTNNGSALWRNSQHSYDSEMFLRMRAAGLVTFARTTSPELGVGPVTEAQVYGGPTRNPWNTDHTSGGSSGGSGAAVAAGIVPAAHGSDGGGSVRIPASSCGLVGFKPTRGRLPEGPGAGEGWGGMAIDGFLTRSLRDTAGLLDAVDGPDLGAPYFPPTLQGTFIQAMSRPPGQLRVALCNTTLSGEPTDPECVAAVENTGKLLQDLGHLVEPLHLPVDLDVESMMVAWTQIVACGTALSVRHVLNGRPLDPTLLDGVTRGAIAYADRLSGSDYLGALNAIHAFGRRMAHLFTTCDVLVTPTLARPPAPVGQLAPTNEDFLDYRTGPGGVFDYSPFTAVFNASGQPAVSLPLHWSATGLPVGVHLAMPFGADETLMALAAQIEIAAPWFARQQRLIDRLAGLA